jgi:signal transduction histidine kinase
MEKSKRVYQQYLDKVKNFFTVLFNNSYYNNFGIIQIFGIIMSINFPLFFIIFYNSTNNFNNAVTLRLLATIISALVIFLPKSSIPELYKKVLWFFSVWFCLPFFFSYYLIQNNMSSIWLVNYISSLFFLFLITDGYCALILATTGFLASFILNLFIIDNLLITLDLKILSTILATIVIGFIFSKNRYLIEKEKTKSAILTNAIMSHEFGTPIATINALSSGKYKSEAEYLNTLNSINHLAFQLSKIIEISRVKLNNVVKLKGCPNILKISFIIQNSIDSFPNNKEEKNKIIKFINDEDFNVYFDSIILSHIFLNLIQNAMRYVRISSNPLITIKIKNDPKYNSVIFSDNGCGISKTNIKNVFKEFFTTSKHGTGLGLYFCRNAMESMGGRISCNSVEGEYTEFVLKFPKMEKNLISY